MIVFFSTKFYCLNRANGGDITSESSEPWRPLYDHERANLNEKIRTISGQNITSTIFNLELIHLIFQN